MTQTLDHAATNPILEAMVQISAALDDAAGANPIFMATTDKTKALKKATVLEARLSELRLRILADAGDVAAQTAAKDIASWEAHQLHIRLEDARADQHLAHALDRRYPVLAAAMCDGLANRAQALVVTHALDKLPEDLPPELLDKAESQLVDYCTDYGPKSLARLGRRILEIVAPDIVDAAEARRLADLEAAAHRKTRLTLRSLGDGTTRISGIVPDAIAQRLATYLSAFTNPRRPGGPATSSSGDGVDGLNQPGLRLPYPRKLGEAFCAVLEAVDPQRLPIHGGDATTLIVTLSLAELRLELGKADILGGLDLPRDDTGPSAGQSTDQITAAQARRLACTANIIPAVLGADSEILDLGRTQRLYSRAQRRAMMLRDGCCRAEGCDIPAAWCDAHHLKPWSQGGATNLADGVSLCSHHHHRAHEVGYRTELLPNGDLRFHRRT